MLQELLSKWQEELQLKEYMGLLFQLMVDEIFKTAMAEKKLDDIFQA